MKKKLPFWQLHGGLPDEIEWRVQAFVASLDAAFQIDERGVVWWREAAVTQLVKGDSLYMPRADLTGSDLLSIDQTQRMQARLANFLVAHIKAVLGRLTTQQRRTKPSQHRQLMSKHQMLRRKVQLMKPHMMVQLRVAKKQRLRQPRLRWANLLCQPVYPVRLKVLPILCLNV